MKKTIILVSFLNFFIIPTLHSQIGIGVETETSLYQWHRSPESQVRGNGGEGQVLSFLSIGPKIWFGDWDSWTISLEGKIGFAPLSLDLGRRSGFGSLTIPTLVKGNFSPFDQAKNGETKIGIGFGVQWTKPELFPTADAIYVPGNPDANANPFFITYIGEISMQIVVRGTSYSNGHSLEFFVRPGFGKESARSFSMGVKYNYRQNYLD